MNDSPHFQKFKTKFEAKILEIQPFLDKILKPDWSIVEFTTTISYKTDDNQIYDSNYEHLIYCSKEEVKNMVDILIILFKKYTNLIDFNIMCIAVKDDFCDTNYSYVIYGI